MLTNCQDRNTFLEILTSSYEFSWNCDWNFRSFYLIFRENKMKGLLYSEVMNSGNFRHWVWLSFISLWKLIQFFVKLHIPECSVGKWGIYSHFTVWKSTLKRDNDFYGTRNIFSVNSTFLLLQKKSLCSKELISRNFLSVIAFFRVLFHSVEITEFYYHGFFARIPSN